MRPRPLRRPCGASNLLPCFSPGKRGSLTRHGGRIRAHGARSEPACPARRGLGRAHREGKKPWRARPPAPGGRAGGGGGWWGGEGKRKNPGGAPPGGGGGGAGGGPGGGPGTGRGRPDNGPG